MPMSPLLGRRVAIASRGGATAARWSVAILAIPAKSRPDRNSASLDILGHPMQRFVSVTDKKPKDDADHVLRIAPSVHRAVADVGDAPMLRRESQVTSAMNTSETAISIVAAAVIVRLMLSLIPENI